MRQLRKGELLHIDKRTRETKQKSLKTIRKEGWFSKLFKSEWRQRCEERLAHYESTNNERKADIYRRKLGK